MPFPGAPFKSGCQGFHASKQFTIIHSPESQQETFRCLFLQGESVDGDDFDIAFSRSLRNSFGI